MSACLKLATTSKFKPGGEEALQKLGAALFKELVKEAEQPREEVEEDLDLEDSTIKSRGLPTDSLEASANDAELNAWAHEKEELAAEISSLRQQLEALESSKAIASLEEHIQPADPGLEEANQRVLELEEENEHLKTEVEKLNAGMTYAKGQFHKLKTVKDEKVAEVADLDLKVDELNKLCSELESANAESKSQLDNFTSEMQQLQDTNTNLLEALDEGRDKESALLETLREMESELDTTRKNLSESDSVTNELRGLHEQIQAKDEDLVVLKEQLNSKDAQISTLRIESDAKDLDLNDFAERLANRDEDIRFMNDQLQEKEANAIQVKDQLEALTERNAAAESHANELQAENSTLVIEKESLVNKMRHAKQQFEKLKKVNEDRGKQITELKATEAQLEEALSQIESLNMQIEEATGGNVTQDLYDHITSMESEMQNIQEQLESANTERLELQTQLTNAAAQLSEADSQTGFLRSQLEGSLGSLQKLEDEVNVRNTQLQESSSQVVQLQEDLQRLIQEQEGASQLKIHYDEASVTIEKLNQELFDKNSAVEMQSQQVVVLERRLEELSIVEGQLRDACSELERAAGNVQHLQACVAERDDELALRSKEVTNLNAELMQFPELQQTAAGLQAQLNELIPQYQAMEQQISDKNDSIQALESRAAFVDELQRELSDRDGVMAAHSQEIAKLEADKQELLLDLEDVRRKIVEMEGEMNEAFEIAELADAQSQKANGVCAEMEEQLRVAHQNVFELEGQVSNLQSDMSSTHAELDLARRTLESQARTEVELQSMKVRLEVADGELQRLRQELVELESAKENLTMVEGSLRTAEAIATSLRQQLEASQERVKGLASSKDQVEDVAAQLQAARSESNVLRQQLAESDALVTSLREEQEQASVSKNRDYTTHQDLTAEYQRLQQELHVAQSDLSASRDHLAASGEEVDGLRQKVMQLETAFAVSGTGSHSGFTSFGTPHTHLGSPASTATPIQDAATPAIDPSFQMKLDSMSKQLADARLQESSLMGDLESLRTELENERKLRSDAQAMLEQTALRTTSGAQSALQISMDGGTNKKDEDIYDVEAAVLSGGDASGFQPMSGLIKGLPFMNYLQPVIKAAEVIDKGFIVLMRQPALRFMLLTYFLLLHIVAFLFGKA